MSEVKPTPIIKPTIGRRVWFRCNDSFAKEKGIYRIDDVQAMDAGIVYVHGDSMVNLIVTDHIGNTHAINSVALVDASDGNSHAMWCEWMPYQKEQAKSKCAVIEPATEQQIEQEIQSKNLNAPRLKPADIDAVIVSEHYFTAAQGEAKALEDGAFVNGSLNGAALRPIPELLSQITFCVLILKNGYKISGVNHSGVSPENHDPELGRKLAYENARNKVWELEGYLLKEKLNHQIKIQEKQITLGDVKNSIQYQHEFFSDEEDKHVVQLKLTDGAVVTELHSNKNHAVILAYQSASNYLQNKINQSSINQNGTIQTPDLPEFKNDDVKSFEPSCSTQACVDGSSSSNGYQLNAKRDNAFLVAQLLSNNKISAELRKKAETKMTALLDELI
ncbi:Gp49 family protein [Acinetobacter ursingii]|uniref:Gp49 family protein n=1 Tax=Acinetobacter ursingii TaxID=108980 RepID=UPI003AF761C2